MDTTGNRSVDERRWARLVGGGSLVEAVFALGAAVVSIAGFAAGGEMRVELLAIAVMAIGSGFLFQGAALADEVAEPDEGTPGAAHSLLSSGAVTVETLVGAGGLSLGFFALIGAAPLALSAVAVLLYGGALLYVGTFKLRTNLRMPATDRMEQATEVGGGAEALVGAGALVLGLLGVFQVATLSLALVATLFIGAAEFVAGSAVFAAAIRPLQARSTTPRGA